MKHNITSHKAMRYFLTYLSVGLLLAIPQQPIPAQAAQTTTTQVVEATTQVTTSDATTQASDSQTATTTQTSDAQATTSQATTATQTTTTQAQTTTATQATTTQAVSTQVTTAASTKATTQTTTEKDTTAINLTKTKIETLKQAITTVQTAGNSLNTLILTAAGYLTEANKLIYTPRFYSDLEQNVALARTDYNNAEKKISAATTVQKAAEQAVKDAEAGKKVDLSQYNTKIEEAIKTLAADTTSKTLTNRKTTLSERFEKFKKNKRADETTKAALLKTITTAESKKKEHYFEDSYNQLQTALASAKTVYNDENSTKTKMNDAKDALTKAITALNEVCTQDGNTFYYDIVNFDVSGDDKTDDTAGLQLALDKANDNINVVISIPDGTYYISNTLYIHSNTTLKLSSNAVIVRDENALGLNMLKATDASHGTTSAGGYDLAHNITVTGGTWNGGNISSSPKECNLLYFGHCNNVTVSNATIKNCYGSHAVEFAGVQNGTVKNCNFSGFRYGSDSYTSEAIQLDICYYSGNTIWAPGYVQDKTSCKNITIKGNTIEDYPRGVGTHHVLSGSPYTNIKIQNNTITRSSASAQGKCITGIFLMGVQNATVTKNTINRYYYGIWIKQSKVLAVKNNKLKYNDYANLVYAGNDVANKTVSFSFVKVQKNKKTVSITPKRGSKTLAYTANTMKTGYLKTGGKTYRFKKAKSYFSVKLKSKLKKNQKITLYGKDAAGNTYYRIYTVAK